MPLGTSWPGTNRNDNPNPHTDIGLFLFSTAMATIGALVMIFGVWIVIANLQNGAKLENTIYLLICPAGPITVGGAVLFYRGISGVVQSQS